MFFWIILGLIVAGVVLAIIEGIRTSDAETGVLGAIASIIVGVIVGALVFLAVCGSSPADKTEVEEATKMSLLPGSEAYVSSAYIDGQQVVSFIVEQDGEAVFESFDEDDDYTIYEDSESDPRLEDKVTYSESWAWPWRYNQESSFEIHIPKGTIIQDYKLGLDSE